MGLPLVCIMRRPQQLFGKGAASKALFGPAAVCVRVQMYTEGAFL